jgi:hypothetical protein
MKINIKGQELEFSFDSVWGPMYTYEEVCGTALPFEPRKTLCMHVMWWCILIRANEGCTVTLDEFVEALNDMQLVRSLADYYKARMEVLTTAQDRKEEKEENKKKD